MSEPSGGAAFDPRLLVVDLDDPDRGQFWRWCALRDLRLQRCRGCHRWRFPPGPRCAHCRSADHTWEPISGTGQIWSFAYSHPPLLAAYAEQAPYPIVVIELPEDESLRMVGNLRTAPGASLSSVPREQVTIGAQVRLGYTQIDETVVLPHWEPIGRSL